jgi:CheY-like chemotaxis protein
MSVTVQGFATGEARYDASASPVLSHMRNKLLLADDDVNATAAVAVSFEAHNFEVRTVTDGITALRSFSTWQPDASMLDIGMPGATGYEVARHVRRTESSGKRILLIAITGEMPPHEVAAKCYSA